MSDGTRFVGSARLIAALTLASRILGLVRDMMCSFVFGASEVMSAFTIGFQIPNLFRRLFGEGALSASSIPVLSERLHHDGPKAVDRVAGNLMGWLLVLLAVLVVIGELVVFALWPLLVNTERDVLTFRLTAVLLPFTIAICGAAILGGIQNVFGQFAVPAANPVVLNLFMIAALVAARPLFSTDKTPAIYLLAGAVVVSGVFQFAWQWASARRCGLKLRLRLDAHDPSVRQIAWTMLPMTFGLGVVQINTLMDNLIAYGLVRSHEGGPAVLFYAQRLYQFPLGVFAIALATAIFPALSRHAAAGDREGMARTLAHGLRVVLFESLPCTVGLILVRRPLIETFLQRGAFSVEDTSRVSVTLAAYAAGIWAFSVNQVAVRAFYAMKDPHTPMRVATWMLGLNLALNLSLVFVLEEAGLALSTTICAIVQTVWLTRNLVRRFGHLDWAGVMRSVGRTGIATGVMAAAVLGSEMLLRHLLGGAVRPWAVLATMTTAGAAGYVGAAWALRCDELREVLHRR